MRQKLYSLYLCEGTSRWLRKILPYCNWLWPSLESFKVVQSWRDKGWAASDLVTQFLHMLVTGFGTWFNTISLGSAVLQIWWTENGYKEIPKKWKRNFSLAPINLTAEFKTKIKRHRIWTMVEIPTPVRNWVPVLK